MAVLDITREIHQIDFEQLRSRNKSSKLFSKSGLYVMVFENTKNTNIRDRNASGNDAFKGKIIIPPNSTVVKFGKFENGLINRIHGYYKHLHYENSPELLIFKDVLKLIYYLDLDFSFNKGSIWNIPRIYEEYWNQSIHSYLFKNKLLSEGQNLRSEYRVLNQTIIETGIHLFNGNYLTKLENFILKSSSLLMEDV